VRAISSVLAASDPSLENAYDLLVHQLEEARGLAESSLIEEFDLESHLKQLRSIESVEDSDEQVSLADALRKQRIKNISIDHQLFRADCFAKRIFVLKLFLFVDAGTMADEILAYKGLLKAFSNYLAQSWRRELQADTAEQSDEKYAMADRLSVLESKVQMSFIRLAKGELTDLPENQIFALGESTAWAIENIKRELKDQKAKLDLWKKALLDADEKGAELIAFVASQRIELSLEVIQSLERSKEILTIITKLLQLHDPKVERVAQ
jgi:hypothetical protein